MGMSTRLIALVSDDDATFAKHKKVLLACYDAEVTLPKETAEYFGTDTADDIQYLLESKLKVDLKSGVHYKEYTEDMTEGIEVYVDKLPKGVASIKFENSW